MDAKQIMEIFADTAYVRTGGSGEEERCARYIAEKCLTLTGRPAALESFAVPQARMKAASFTADGREVPCKGYLCGAWRLPSSICPTPTPAPWPPAGAAS